MTEKKEETIKEQYLKKGWWKKQTHGDLLSACAVKYGSKIAIVDDRESITFQELDDKTDRLAAWFLNSGLKKGDRILLQGINRISYAMICFAFFKIGVIPITILPSHREIEVRGILESSEACGYICVKKYHGYDYQPLVDKMTNQFDFLKNVWYIEDLEKINLEQYELSDCDFEKPEYDDPAIFVLSGGTTGIPKMIPRVHASFRCEQDACARAFGVDENSVVLVSMPLSHAWNLVGPGMIGSLLQGAQVVLSYNGTADEILDAVQKYKVTSMGLVPSLILTCMDILRITDEYDLSSLKSIQIGGAMSTGQLLLDAMDAFGCVIQQAYGMSEGLVCATRMNDENSILISTHGRPVCEGDDLQILDEDENPVEPGGEGEIAAKGPCLFDGYYNNPSANSRAFSGDGYYLTGDRGRILSETGYLQVTGRVKEQINRMGEKIMPSELEEYLIHYPGVEEVYVVPANDRVLTQRIVVFIKTDDKNLTLKDIRSFLEEQNVASYKMPDQLILREEWPYTGVGKVDKKKLQSIAENTEKQRSE